MASGAPGPEQNQASTSGRERERTDSHSEVSCKNVRLIFLNPQNNDFIRVESSMQVRLVVDIAREGKRSTEAEAQCGAQERVALKNASVDVELYESFNWLGHVSDLQGHWMHGNESFLQWQSSPLTLPSEQQILSFRAILQVRLDIVSRRQEGRCHHQAPLLNIERMCEVHSQVQVVAARDSITIETLSYRPVAFGAEIVCNFIARILTPMEGGTGGGAATGGGAPARVQSGVCTAPPTVSLELVGEGAEGHLVVLNTTDTGPDPLCFASGQASRLVRGYLVYRDANRRVLHGSNLRVRLLGRGWEDQKGGVDQGSGLPRFGEILPTHVHDATLFVPTGDSGGVSAAGSDELHVNADSKWVGW